MRIYTPSGNHPSEFATEWRFVKFVIASATKQSRRLEYDDYTIRFDLYCGVNIPDETGKMSQSDKRGATLPKVATVATLSYSAINANAFETVVLAIVIQLQSPYEYLR